MRTIVAFGAALFITAILFLLMQGLIRDNAPVIDEAVAPPKVALVDVPPEELEPPEPPVDPPIPKPAPLGPTSELTVVVPEEPIVGPPIEHPTRGVLTPTKTALSETPSGGDPVPIAVFPPRYPQHQLMARVEGWVRVGFTIDAEGAVKDAQVIDANPRRGLFDNAALTAIQRWQFAPRRDDSGNPVASRAAYTIEFKLDDGV